MLKKSLMVKMLASLVSLSSAAFAQDNGTGTLIEVLILVAILFIMAGVPIYRKYAG